MEAKYSVLMLDMVQVLGSAIMFKIHNFSYHHNLSTAQVMEYKCPVACSSQYITRAKNLQNYKENSTHITRAKPKSNTQNSSHRI